MIEKEFTIENEAGLHARPAAKLIQVANLYESDIRIIKGNKVANAKSLLSVLALGIFKGSTVLIRVTGPDELSALLNIQKLIESNFSSE